MKAQLDGKSTKRDPKSGATVAL